MKNRAGESLIPAGLERTLSLQNALMASCFDAATVDYKTLQSSPFEHLYPPNTKQGSIGKGSYQGPIVPVPKAAWPSGLARNLGHLERAAPSIYIIRLPDHSLQELSWTV